MLKWIVGAALLAAASIGHTKPVQGIAAKVDQPFHRGVNVLGYDPYWRDPAHRRFQWSHFTEIRRAGFDFVRVNLQAFKFMDAQKRLNPAWLAKLDDVVGEAQKAGLGVILDEHDFDKCSSDIAACREQLLAFWSQVAPRYANAPRNVAFELLNEPHDKLNGEPWNNLLVDVLPIVRQTNPTRIVVVGPTHWNSLKDLSDLKLPDDPNLLVTFHYYEPFHFTHQGATWAGEEVKKLHGITWGSAQDRAAIAADFDQVAAWSAANRRPILLGEFGAYDKTGTPVELRAAYTAADRCEAERRGFSWAYWQFEGDFIVWDTKRNDWIQPVKDALIPASQAAKLRSASDCGSASPEAFGTEERKEMLTGKLAAAALIAAASSAVVAQDTIDPAKQIVNDPSAPEVNGAKAKLVTDPKVQGGTALRVDVSRKGSNPWDSIIGGAIKKPIAKGDRLVLLFSARLHKGQDGAATAILPYNAIQLATAPYSTIINGPAEIGPEWKDFQVTGTADGNYPAGALKVTIQLATAKQTVDFGPIVVLDRGK